MPRVQSALQLHIARLHREATQLEGAIGAASDPADIRLKQRYAAQIANELDQLTAIANATMNNPTAQGQQYMKWQQQKAMGR